MAYSYQDVMAALRAADAAGNVEDAARLAKIAANYRGDITPEPTAAPTQADTSSDFVRGFKSYIPQTKEIIGGAETILGKAVDSEGLIKKGLSTIQQAQQEQAPLSKPSDSLANAWDKGIGTVLTDWLPYQAGIGAANVAESLAFLGVGTAAGLMTPVPGGAAAGGISGFVGKQLIKKGIKDQVEKIAAEKGLEEAEKFTAKKTAEFLASDEGKKELKKYLGGTAGIGVQAELHGLGEVSSRAIEEKIANAKTPEERFDAINNLDTTKLLATSQLHAVADFISTKIGLGALEKLSTPTKNFFTSIGKNILVTGTKEVPPELMQTALERYGADLPLSDLQAIKEYIDTAGASYAMMAIPGTVGGVRGYMANKPAEEGKEEEVTLKPEEVDAANKKALESVMPTGKVDPKQLKKLTSTLKDAALVTQLNDIFGGKKRKKKAEEIVDESVDAQAARTSDEVSGQQRREDTEGTQLPDGSGLALSRTDMEPTRTGEETKYPSLKSLQAQTIEEIPVTDYKFENKAKANKFVKDNNLNDFKVVMAEDGFGLQPKSVLPDISFNSILQELQSASSLITNPAQVKSFIAENFNPTQVQAIESEAKVNQDKLYGELFKFYKQAQEAPRKQELLSKLGEKARKDTDKKYYSTLPKFFSTKPDYAEKTPIEHFEALRQENPDLGYNDISNVGIEIAASEEEQLKHDLADIDGFNKAVQAIRDQNEVNYLIDKGMSQEEAISKIKETNYHYNFSTERPTEFIEPQAYMNLYEQFLNRKAPTKTQQKQKANRDEFISTLTPEQQQVLAQRQANYSNMLLSSVNSRVQGEAREATNAKLRGKTVAQSLKQKQSAEARLAKREQKRLQKALEEANARRQLAAAEAETPGKTYKGLSEQITEEQVKEDLTVKNRIDRNVLRDIVSGKTLSNILKTIAGVSEFKDYSYQHTAEYFNKLFDSLEAKGVKTDVKIKIGQIKNGKPGQFNPKTNTITIDPNNLNGVHVGQVIVHETTHYALDHIIDNKDALTKDQLQYLKQLEDIYEYVRDSIGDQFEIGNLKEFVSEATSNADFGIAMGNLPSKLNRLSDVLKDLAKTIAGALGFTKYSPTKPVILEHVLHNIQSILSGEDYTTPTPSMRGQETSYAPKTTKQPKVAKEEKEPLTAEKIINNFQDLPTSHRTTFPERIGRLFQGEKTADNLVKTFQNSRYFLKKWQRQFDRANLIQRVGNNFNNIYDLVSTAFGRAQIIKSSYVFEHEQQLYQALQAYADAAGVDLNQAFKTLMGYRIAVHEPERRAVKFLLTAPIEQKAADMRERILNMVTSKEVAALPEGERKALMAQLRAKLDEVVYNNLDKAGYSEEGYINTDPNASEYNVIKGFNSQQVAMLQAKLAKDPNKKYVDEVFKIMNTLNKVTIDLNRMGHYWTPSTDAITEFYGWENYSPFKVKPGEMSEKNRARFNIEGTRLGKEGRDYPGTFEGSERESENPVLQTLVEATLAVARAGRKDVTQAIKNAVEQKLIKGDAKYGEYTFTERYNNKVDDKKLREKNVVYHYNDDGSMNLIKIDDPNIVEAIRRTYNDNNQIINLINSVTSGIGQLHTRYNLPFAPMNFLRDVLTNAFVIGVDKDLKTAGQYATGAASDIMTNFNKTNKVARAFNRNDIKEIKRLAADDKSGYVNDLLEYLMAGGNVSVVQGLSAAGQLEQLWRSADKGKVLKTKQQIDKFFDSWMSTFEFSARVSAYRVVKKDLIQKYKDKGVSPKEAEKASVVEATAYTKNLANFEEVGDWGRGMGAAFVFFRASATGAVRAIDSLAPAFRSWESVKTYLPSEIKDNAQALADYKANYLRQQQQARIVAGGLMGVGYVAYIMSAMFAGHDDDDRNKVLTDDLSRWTRYARLSIGDDKMVQIPWGFGFGAFGAIGAQVAGAIHSQGNSLTSVMANITNIGLDSFLPLPVSKISPFDNPSAFLMDSVTPSLLRPIYEYTMNVNTFGQQIYNNRQSRYGDAYTGGDNIPDIYKDAAKTLYKLTGIDWSPNTMYFFSNNYADGLTRLAQNGYGAALTMMGSKDFNPKSDLFLLESFISNRSDIDARQYGEIEKKILDKEKQLNMLKQDPEALETYLDKHPDDAGVVKAFNQETGRILNDLREQANIIRRSDLSRIEKTELLKENRQLQNAVKKNIYEALEPYLD